MEENEGEYGSENIEQCMYESRALRFNVCLRSSDIGGNRGSDIFAHHHSGSHIEVNPAGHEHHHRDSDRSGRLKAESENASHSHEQQDGKNSIGRCCYDIGFKHRKCLSSREVLLHIKQSQEHKRESENDFSADFTLLAFGHCQYESQCEKRIDDGRYAKPESQYCNDPGGEGCSDIGTHYHQNRL